MQRYPGHRMPFPQWQQGMEPSGQIKTKKTGVQFPTSIQDSGPRQQTLGLSQGLLPFPSQSDNQGFQRMNNGNGKKNNIASSQNHKTKAGSHKWTNVGGIWNNDTDLQEMGCQDAKAYGQQIRQHQQQSSRKRIIKIRRPSDLNTAFNSRIVPDQPHIISSTSSHAFQNNNNGPFMKNNSGPSRQNNSGPFMQNNMGLSVQNNSGLSVQDNSGPSMQNNSFPSLQNNIHDSSVVKNSSELKHNSASFQFMQNKNGGQFMQNNNRKSFMLSNSIPFNRSFNCLQSNRNQLETGQNKPDSDVEILTFTPSENMQSKDKLSPFKNTFGSNLGRQSLHYTDISLKNRHKKTKSQALKQHQKILMLQKELNEKNVEMSRFTKEVEELEDKTAEVMKSNKHLEEVIKMKDLELEANKTLMTDMKAEIKCAKKEVLNCLQRKVAKSQEALKLDPVTTIEKANIEVQNRTHDFKVGKKDVADDHTSSRLCLKIKSFLEFNGLAQKISTSIEKILDMGDKSVMTNLKLGRQDVESAISSFNDDVLLLFDEVTSLIQKKVEVEICLTDIEKSIEQKQVKLGKITYNIEDLLRKVKTLSKKDLKTSVEAHALRGELESVKTELELLRKHHRKLEIDNKRVVNKLNVMTNDLNLDIEIL